MKKKRHTIRMRLGIFAVVVLGVMMISGAALAHGTELDGPDPAIWLSDPDGVDGDSGIEQGDPVAGSSGTATVRGHHATIRVKATGLVPGHAYTLWVVYFNDQKLCIDGCNGPDFAAAGGGVIWGAGKVANHHGNATFTANLTTGDGAGYVGDAPPPPYAVTAFEAGLDNEFHVVVRSHGPQIDGLVHEQLTTFGGGCEIGVGPKPEQIGDFPVPSAPGECGNVQLYGFK